MSAVVSDSSPLNYLALLSDFDLLRQIYGTLIIPPAVYSETVENATGYPVQAAVRAARCGHAASLTSSKRTFPSACKACSTCSRREA